MTNNQGKQKHSVALLVPDLAVHSGIPVATMFLHKIISASDAYAPEIISVSSSMRDANSTHLLSPGSWFKSVTQTTGEWFGIPVRHVGAELTELEFQRYRPRRVLTELLDEFDIVQVVAGCPPWGLLAKNVKGKVALLTASLTVAERASKLKHLRGGRRAWEWLMTKINTALEKPAMRSADVIFVINRWMYDHLKSLYGENKVVFAPAGIDTDFFSPAGYKVDGYILAVGRFNDPRKNVRLIFDFYHRLRQERQDVPRLVLAGEFAPLPDDFKYAESLGIMPHVDMHWSVSLEKLKTLYQNASLFLLSSNEEGLGFVIAEAMACGIPVVSTRCGGPEVLVLENVTGHMTPVGDALEMKSKVLALLDNPELRQKMSRAARLRAVEHFSLEATGKVFLKHYDALLNGSL